MFDRLPRWLGSKESACQCRRPGFDPWGQEDALEKEMAAHSSILAWRIPWTEEPGGLQSMGLQRDTTEHTFIQDTHLIASVTQSWPESPGRAGAPAPSISGHSGKAHTPDDLCISSGAIIFWTVRYDSKAYEDVSFLGITYCFQLLENNSST